MREIVLDAETTGLDPAVGHRVVEIGCVELLNHLPTGRVYQTYIDPEREMPEEAFEIHGLSDAFLADMAPFRDVVEAFLEFLADSKLVIHNASFDLKFLNAELAALDRPALPAERALDTVALARRKFPGAPANLDALCKRFGIDASARDKHGALLDAELLAEVYLELIGGRQAGLALAGAGQVGVAAERATRSVRPARAHRPTAEELAAHERFLAVEVDDPIWHRE